jgi:sulfonate transport system substrate-binding protein
MFRKLLGILFLSIFIVGSVGCSGLDTNKENQTSSSSSEEITVKLGTLNGPYVALFDLGEKMNFFKEEGIILESTHFDLAKDAFVSLIDDEQDISVCGQSPVVDYSLKRDDFKIVSIVASNNNTMKLLARKDSGIHEPKDIAGKKVAVAPGTAYQYFVEAVREYYYIDDIEIVPAKPAEGIDKVKSGEADVTSNLSVFIDPVAKEMGGKCNNF